MISRKFTEFETREVQGADGAFQGISGAFNRFRQVLLTSQWVGGGLWGSYSHSYKDVGIQLDHAEGEGPGNFRKGNALDFLGHSKHLRVCHTRLCKTIVGRRISQCKAVE